MVKDVSPPTWEEDDGKGNPTYYIDATFRSYETMENSLQDCKTSLRAATMQVPVPRLKV